MKGDLIIIQFWGIRGKLVFGEFFSMSPSRSDPRKPTRESADADAGGIGACRRCGTCCRRGGPALHLVDKSLVIEGHLSLADLYTIRSGERVRDDVAGGVLVPAESDIIKIREAPGSRACVRFAPGGNRCTIYAERPLECRVLRCWDTTEIQRCYRKDRLARVDLIGHIEGLWDLVAEHDQRCHAGRLTALAPHRGNARERTELSRMIRYDEALRAGLTADGRVPAAILDFLLGRPVRVLLRALGVEIKPTSPQGAPGEAGTG
jgi:Fe-S-cluster containining protein